MTIGIVRYSNPEGRREATSSCAAQRGAAGAAPESSTAPTIPAGRLGKRVARLTLMVDRLVARSRRLRGRLRLGLFGAGHDEQKRESNQCLAYDRDGKTRGLHNRRECRIGHGGTTQFLMDVPLYVS